MQTTDTARPRARNARPASSPPASPKTKKDQFVELLRARAGSDVKTLSDALGWQAHTVRAALTGLRKAGITVEKMPARDGELTRYRINAKRGR
jgi:hypothetical protein